MGVYGPEPHAAGGRWRGGLGDRRAGFDVVQWAGLTEKVLISSLAAPFLGVAGAELRTLVILWIVR